MKRIAVLLILCLALAACGQSGSAAQPPAAAQPSVGAADNRSAAAHDFTLATLDGGNMALSDLQGEWVLVNFWATWCPPCVAEMEYLEQLHQTRNINVLGINYNEQADVVQKFVDAHAVTFPILMAPDDDLKMAYEARALPRTVVIAPDGRVANRLLGQLLPDQFNAWLDANQVPLR